jgi:hypothetical protein
MRDPTGDWERMHRRRRNNRFILIFGSLIVIALLISILGTDLQIFR